MKPVAFEYECARDIDSALKLLGQSYDACVLAGGQTLGPMLNLRLVQPELVVDITRIEALVRSEIEQHTVTLGACISHAAIEDERVTDTTHGYLPRVAAGIAYRAVRNRGTIGGSVANADPAADWLTCFTALGADILLSGLNGERICPIDQFVTGAMETTLGPDEMVNGVRIPRPGRAARSGYAKISRKPGEFADAIAAIMHDPDNNRCRVVVGATDGAPLRLDIHALDLSADSPLPTTLDADRIRDELARHMPTPDLYRLNIQGAVVQRALADANADVS